MGVLWYFLFIQQHVYWSYPCSGLIRLPYCWTVIGAIFLSFPGNRVSQQISHSSGFPPLLLWYSLNLRCQIRLVDSFIEPACFVISCFLHFYQLCFSVMVSVCSKETFLWWGLKLTCIPRFKDESLGCSLGIEGIVFFFLRSTNSPALGTKPGFQYQEWFLSFWECYKSKLEGIGYL